MPPRPPNVPCAAATAAVNSKSAAGRSETGGCPAAGQRRVTFGWATGGFYSIFKLFPGDSVPRRRGRVDTYLSGRGTDVLGGGGGGGSGVPVGHTDRGGAGSAWRRHSLLLH